MTERQIFGLVLRTAGLFVILQELMNPWRFTSVRALLVSVPTLLLGVYLVRGAPRILSMSFPDDCCSPRQPDA